MVNGRSKTDFYLTSKRYIEVEYSTFWQKFFQIVTFCGLICEGFSTNAKMGMAKLLFQRFPCCLLSVWLWQQFFDQVTTQYLVWVNNPGKKALGTLRPTFRPLSIPRHQAYIYASSLHFASNVNK